MKAGQAILFDGRMIHSSEPNYSDFDRDNIVMRINHNKSDYFSMQTDSNKAKKGNIYSQGKDYFFTNQVTEHNIKPINTPKMGEMYLFYNDVQDEYIGEKLKD